MPSYDRLVMQNLFRNMPDFRYCLRPGCDFGQIHDGSEGNNVFRCVHCGFRVCTTHDVPMHTDETCAQYDKRQQLEQMLDTEQAKATQAVLDDETSRCPGCGLHIQKTEGCDHMTCKFDSGVPENVRRRL
jgi:E3 ubiquitin-protein ligase RNF14